MIGLSSVCFRNIDWRARKDLLLKPEQIISIICKKEGVSRLASGNWGSEEIGGTNAQKNEGTHHLL
jgi:hypothetical protein